MKNLLDKIRWSWKWTAPGAVLFAFGIYFLAMWPESQSIILALLFVVCCAGGVFLIRHGLKGAYPPGLKQVKGKGKKAVGPPPNSFNIYPNRADFEYVRNPLGMPQRYLNDSQEYFVHKWNPDTKKLEEWVLPDSVEEERHYDPAEFYNVVTMPCSKKYLEWVPNTFQKIAFGVMGAIVGLEVLALIVFAG